MHQMQRAWVLSQHPSAQWNLRGGRWSSAEYCMKKIEKIPPKKILKKKNKERLTAIWTFLFYLLVFPILSLFGRLSLIVNKNSKGIRRWDNSNRQQKLIDLLYFLLFHYDLGVQYFMFCRFWSDVCTVVLLMRARLSGLIGPQFWSIDHSDGWLDTSSSYYNYLWPHLQFLFTGGTVICKVNFFYSFLLFYVFSSSIDG